MTVARKQILPALHKSDKVKNPDMPNIEDSNYTSTILKYSNLALPFPQLDTNAKTVVAAINELYHTKSTVIPNPPGETPTDTLNTVKIDGTVFNIEGGGGGGGISGYETQHYIGTNASNVSQVWDEESVNTVIQYDFWRYQAIEFPVSTTEEFTFNNDSDIVLDADLNFDVTIDDEVYTTPGSGGYGLNKDTIFGYEVRFYLIDTTTNTETFISEYTPQEIIYDVDELPTSSYNLYYNRVEGSDSDIEEWLGYYDSYKLTAEPISGEYHFDGEGDGTSIAYEQFEEYSQGGYGPHWSSDGGCLTTKAVIAEIPKFYYSSNNCIGLTFSASLGVGWGLVDPMYEDPNNEGAICRCQFTIEYCEVGTDDWQEWDFSVRYNNLLYAWEMKGTPGCKCPEIDDNKSFNFTVESQHNIPLDSGKEYSLRLCLYFGSYPKDPNYSGSPYELYLYIPYLVDSNSAFTLEYAVAPTVGGSVSGGGDSPDEGNSPNSDSGSGEPIGPHRNFYCYLKSVISRDFTKLLTGYIVANKKYRIKTTFSFFVNGFGLLSAGVKFNSNKAITRIEGYKELHGGGGGSYVLPIASAETLGGIKVGSGLSIDSETGVLSANDDGVEYYPGRGIFFSAEITEEFYTEAPQESGSGAGLSYTTCPLKYKADTTYGNPVTICHPIRGSLFGGVYDSTTNSVLVTCRDYVPEGTLIQIKYTANITEANSINAEAGRKSSAYTYIQFRTDYVSPKDSWKSTGTYIDGNLVRVSQAITDPPYKCFSWGQLEITGIEDITLYVKQDSINTNTAYILISKPGETFRVKTTDTFNGDGVTNVFTLSHEVYRPPMAPYVTFEPSGSYPNTISGNTITFTGNIPPVGTKISVQYYYMDTSSNKVFKSYKGITTSDYVSCYMSLGGGSSDYYQRVVDILYVKDGDATISNSVAYFYYEAGTAYIGANGEIFNDYNNNYAIGFQSHAEGGSSLAMGNRSHAEGMSTAVGSFSHSEGDRACAYGYSSHAEGTLTVASGSASHAEGIQTVASGQNSHAEGTHTQALGNHSHSEGGSTYAEGTNSHSEGVWTHATGGESHAEGDNTRALSSSAHAEGQLTIAEGAQSHAEGSGTKASGQSSHAEGNYTRALGYTSHAEGNYSQATAQYSHAEGSNTVASNYYAHAEGNSTEASGGDGAHAEGNNTIARGSSAHAEGTHTQAIGSGSHAGGGYSIASGQYSYAMGDNATASGDYSHSEGQTTVASGDRSHAEGRDTTASGNSAHAEGDGTIASNSYTHAEGQNSVASNAAAHAEGYGSTASGYVSHAEGYQTQARATGTHTEGYQTQATQNYAHAEGAYNIASGFESHAEGVHTIAVGNFSHAEGRGVEDVPNVAAGIGSHAEGFQSQATGDASHAEGGGTRAIGQESHSEGAGTWAYGKWSHAEGAGNRVFANYSHVEGAGVEVIKEYSHAEGAGNKCIGGYNHIEGGGNVSTNHMSHTEGAGNTNDGIQAHAEGAGNGLSGDEAHVEGAGNRIHAPKSHGEGGGNSLYGLGSHVEGKHNEVAGFAVHAEGGWNFVGTDTTINQFFQTSSYNVGDIVGPNSAYVNFSDSMEQTVSQYLYRCITAPGQIQSGNGVEFITPVTWDSSTAYTSGTVILYLTNNGIPLYYYANKDIPAGVIPPLSDSVGAGWQRIESILSPFKTTTSSGYYLLNADRLGSNVVAKVANGTTVQAMWEPIPAPKYTHVEGYRNIALGDYQHVAGKYSSSDANKAVIIGNGENNNGVITRSNAYTLDWDGNAAFAGDVTLGTPLSTTAQTVAAAINELYQTGGGSQVSVTQKVSTGTNIADIIVDGVTTQLFAPTSGGSNVIVTPVQLSGNHIADIEVDGVTSELYSPEYTSTEVEVTQVQSSGTKIATIGVDGNETDIYAPDVGDSVTVTQITTTGTHIADIEVDGVTTELYAPNAGGAVIDDSDIALDKTWSSQKINEMFFELAQRVAAIERYLWGQPVLTEDGDNRVTEDDAQRILEENEE